MAFEIIMPKLGVDMQEGEIIEWKKQEGDVVNEGDILLEIMSDKTNMELEAEDSGVLLKITRQAGETVPVTEVIGYIGAEGEVVADNAASAPVAEATAQLESAGLEVPKAPAQAAPAAVAEKAPLADNEYDIIVVGGGPAGYYSAIRGAQLGGKVAIVEKSEFGGTCLNKGCIPTKTYLKNAEILDGLKIAAGRGINLASTNYTIDMDKTVDFKNSVVKTLTGGVQGLLKANKVTIFNGLGQVNPDKTVTIGSETIKGRNIILDQNMDFVKEKLYGDEDLHAEVGQLRDDFMNHAQALIHGDLHSGSIFVNQEGTKVIDPEFAFYGPMGYDIGNVIGNLFFAWANKYYTDSENTEFLTWIEKTIGEVTDKFKEKFSAKWDALVEFPLYKTEGFKKYYTDKVMADSFGYAGTEIIRRVVGDSKVKEVTSVTNVDQRVPMERALIQIGIKLIKERRTLKDGAAIKAVGKEYLK